MGSLLGLAVGVAMILVAAWNYSYMMRLHPDSGGLYTYVKTAFGYDRAFLSSWFLVITYLAMLWANATSLPLFADRFFGDVFRFGYLYTVFGYDVYVGEALLTIAVLVVAGFLCARGKSVAAKSMIALCFVFVAAMEGSDYLNRAQLVECFREKVEANVAAGDVVVSEGLAEYWEDFDKRVQLVFERADALMYERKMQLKAKGAAVRD